MSIQDVFNKILEKKIFFYFTALWGVSYIIGAVGSLLHIGDYMNHYQILEVILFLLWDIVDLLLGFVLIVQSLKIIGTDFMPKKTTEELVGFFFLLWGISFFISGFSQLIYLIYHGGADLGTLNGLISIFISVILVIIGLQNSGLQILKK